MQPMNPAPSDKETTMTRPTPPEPYETWLDCICRDTELTPYKWAAAELAELRETIDGALRLCDVLRGERRGRSDVFVVRRYAAGRGE